MLIVLTATPVATASEASIAGFVIKNCGETVEVIAQPGASSSDFLKTDKISRISSASQPIFVIEKVCFQYGLR